MLIRNTNQGWFWGSKGPFPSSAKALQVAREAHSAGFKEGSTMTIDLETCGEFVGTLLHSATVTHFQHLSVEGVGADAAHRALNEYYDGIVELTDNVAECVQGAYDVIIKPYPSAFENNADEPLSYMRKLRSYVRVTRSMMPADSEIQNEIDSIAMLINRTCYRLQRLK